MNERLPPVARRALSALGGYRLSSLLVAACFAALSLGAWAYWNTPRPEPEWPDRIRGVGFSPFRSGEDPTQGDEPTLDAIAADLELLAPRVHSVRTYTAIGPFAEVPRLADAHHLQVALGAWLDTDRDRNEAEVSSVIDLSNDNANVVRIFVGNETLLRGDLTPDELADYLDRVAAATEAPVGTAEPWHVWLKHPELAEHVDFIGIHLLPYWEGVEVEAAVAYAFACYQQVADRFPDLPIVIGEVGWPSRGRMLRDAIASPAHEALFLRRFLARAEAERLAYYVMEAFDQPWKASGEGEVGAYWGIFDVERQAKFALSEPIVRVPEWHLLAAVSIAMALLLMALVLSQGRRLLTRGRLVVAAVAFATAPITVWVIFDTTRRYLSAPSVVVAILLLIGMLGLFVVLFAETYEWTEASWGSCKDSHKYRISSENSGIYPKVSIHVPAYNEPPDMLIATIDALLALNYPNFEVLVIDNNTRDEALWRPVAAHCQRLDPDQTRLRFFHVDRLEGFKAGALNYVLARTAPDAAVVAVIDSDYQVDPDWLDLVQGFADPAVAIMQAPQDYRDGRENLFKAASFAEYRGFFAIGMVTRDAHNAIIQHGTMTLVRRSVLEAVGGWATDSITEDAELGLRIFERGQIAHYVARSYGRGLMPDTFLDFKKQRFRWAYGAMQILKGHWRTLIGARPGLTRAQRYQFVAGWLPWLADGLNLLVTVLALGWSLAMLIDPNGVAPPSALLAALPLGLFAFKIIKLAHLYRVQVGATARETFAAALAGLALSPTIAWAVVKGLLTSREPFFRTPKLAQHQGWVAALRSATAELAVGLALVGAVVALGQLGPDFQTTELTLWKAMLLIQACPYAAAVLVSLISAFPLPASWLGATRLARRTLVASEDERSMGGEPAEPAGASSR